LLRPVDPWPDPSLSPALVTGYPGANTGDRTAGRMDKSAAAKNDVERGTRMTPFRPLNGN
jgi:hypothetical protein